MQFRGERTVNGRSSIGRVAVSKTVGWEFESLHPCTNRVRNGAKSKVKYTIRKRISEVSIRENGQLQFTGIGKNEDEQVNK